jgi:hypothetical protein
MLYGPNLYTEFCTGNWDKTPGHFCEGQASDVKPQILKKAGQANAAYLNQLQEFQKSPEFQIAWNNLKSSLKGCDAPDEIIPSDSSNAFSLTLDLIPSARSSEKAAYYVQMNFPYATQNIVGDVSALRTTPPGTNYLSAASSFSEAPAVLVFGGLSSIDNPKELSSSALLNEMSQVADHNKEMCGSHETWAFQDRNPKADSAEPSASQAPAPGAQPVGGAAQ